MRSHLCFGLQADQYTIIGECFLRGFMDGEAFIQARMDADPGYDGIDTSWLQRLHEGPYHFRRRNSASYKWIHGIDRARWFRGSIETLELHLFNGCRRTIARRRCTLCPQQEAPVPRPLHSRSANTARPAHSIASPNHYPVHSCKQYLSRPFQQNSPSRLFRR
jgi:hypothetical protein